MCSKNLYSLRFDVNHFQYVVFKVHLIFNGSEISDPNRIMRIELMHCIPNRIILIYYNGLKWTRTTDLTLIRRAL